MISALSLYRLGCLMQEFRADRLVSKAVLLRSLALAAERQKPTIVQIQISRSGDGPPNPIHIPDPSNDPIGEESKTALIANLNQLLPECVALRLKASHASIHSFMMMLEDNGAPTPPSFADVGRAADELEGRLRDELREMTCLSIEGEEEELYLDKAPFGSLVADHIGEAIEDIEEAAKCLAFERDTAAVFHLMRVMEVGLKLIARWLGVPYAPSWESYLLQINTRIAQKHRRKGIKWKRDEPFFRDVAGDLMTVKVAWRNPTMHVVRQYKHHEAREIFNAVRNLMQRLASRVASEASVGGVLPITTAVSTERQLPA